MKKQNQGCDCSSGCTCGTKTKQKITSASILFMGGFLSAVTIIVATSGIANKNLRANIGEGESFTPHQAKKIDIHQPRFHSAGGEYQQGDPYSEFTDEVEEYQDLDEIEAYDNNIEEIDVVESGYLEELHTVDPNSYDYWQIRNKIADLKAKKNDIRHKKRQLQSQLKQKKMEKIENKKEQIEGNVTDRKQVFEECRAMGKDYFATCLKENLGKQKNRDQLGGKKQLEQKPQKELKSIASSDDKIRPNSLQPQKNNNPITVRDIVNACIKTDPTDLKECIREGVQGMVEQLLEQTRQHRLQQAERKSYESNTSTGKDENWHPQARPGNMKAVPSPTPYADDMPQTDAEWREYNERFNTKPTI